jgi:hypothetical protein
LGRKLFIHVGPMKTGTTALQNILRDHDGSLVLYPKTGQYGTGAHHNLVYNFLGNYSNSPTVREDSELLFERVAAETRQSDAPVVISSEVLVMHSRTGEFIKKLLDHLGGGFDVEILFAMREYFARAASLYSQMLRDERYRECGGPDEFIVRRAPMVAYEPALSLLKETGFKIHLFEYDPAPEFAPRFLKYLGFPEDRIPQIPVQNRSLSIKGMVVRVAINRAVSSLEERREFAPVLQQLHPKYGRSHFIFGQEAAKVAAKRFRYDRAIVREQFGIAAPMLDTTALGNPFRIIEKDYEQIMATAVNAGAARDRFGECLREFVRSPSAR